MPQLTVLVPLLHDVEAFEATLASVLRFGNPDFQVLGLHDGNYQDQYGIGAEVQLISLDHQSRPTVLGMMSQAIPEATGTWLHWISPGVEATSGWCDQILETISARRDLGSISPQVLPGVERDEESNLPTGLGDDSECLASSVVVGSGFHPKYLEELVGESWKIDDLGDATLPIVPTHWAGFCSRELFAQWASTQHQQIRLGDGYREMAFGLFLKEDGWQHQVVQSALVASAEVQEEIETDWEMCGSTAGKLLATYHTGSTVQKLTRSLVTAAGEMARGVLAPSMFGIAAGRISALGALLSKPKRAGSSSNLDDNYDLLPVNDESFQLDAPASSSNGKSSPGRRAA